MAFLTCMECGRDTISKYDESSLLVDLEKGTCRCFNCIVAENKHLRAEMEAKDKKIGFLSRQFEAENDHTNWLEKQNKQLRAELEVAQTRNIPAAIKALKHQFGSFKEIGELDLQDAVKMIIDASHDKIRG